MADNWPFLHLNLLSPDLPSKGPSLNASSLQDGALNSLELNRQLEAWSNIDFNFDLDPVSEPHPANSSLAFSSRDSLDSLAPSAGPYDRVFDYPSSDSYHHHPSSSPAYVVPSNPSALQHLHDISVPTPELVHAPLQASTIIPTTSLAFSDLSKTESLKTTPHFQHNLSLPSTANFDSTPTPQSTTHLKSDLPVLDDEEANKIAVEDDKRRRNTLASARFRMKKKMKEQEIERTAQEMKDRVNDLEKQVELLTQENKWLRGLIVEQAATKASINSNREVEIPAVSILPTTKRIVEEDESPALPPTRTKVGRKPSANKKKIRLE